MIEFDASLVIMLVALLLAGVFSGMTGFGFSLVATPLLSLIMSVKDTATLVLIFIFITSFASFYQLRRSFSWKLSWDYVIGISLGVLVGVYALVKVDEIILRRALGFVLIGVSIHETFLKAKISTDFVRKCGFPLALMSGALAGSFNMGGPPAVVYAYSQRWSKEDVIIQLQNMFLVSAIIRASAVGLTGAMNAHLGMLCLIGAVPVVAGNVFGQKLFHLIPENRLRQIVFFALGLLGIKFAIWS
jgi:uncharacterized protein